MLDAPQVTEVLSARQEDRRYATYTTRRLMHIALAFVAAIVLVSVLCGGARGIAPLVESDYCYLLTAADRFQQGLGLTTTPPVAPLQPWEWHADWTFLTKWPVGYPLLIAAIRFLFGLTSLQAASWISATCAVASLLGWYLLTLRFAPRGLEHLTVKCIASTPLNPPLARGEGRCTRPSSALAGILLAGVTAASTVSIDALINPSTDFIVTAALPWIILGALHNRSTLPSAELSVLRYAALGFAAAALCWIRYASIAVPVGVGAYIFVAWRRKHRTFYELIAYTAAASGPIAALLLINRFHGGQSLTPAQMNLGDKMDLSFSWSLLADAWWRFTDLGFYDYRWMSHWVYALWPPVLIFILVVMQWRRGDRRQAHSAHPAKGSFPQSLLLPALVALTTLGMLIAVTTLFGGKFHYVSLDRYYQPIRPLYFILFVSPMLLLPHRLARAGLSLCLLIAASWTVRQEWIRPLRQASTVDALTTPYGARGVCFGADANKLYNWLRIQNARELVLISNFHEFIELETGIPAIPIPPDPRTLERWLEDIINARGVQNLSVLFVLDPNNKWRNYWIADPLTIAEDFHLTPADVQFRGARIFAYDPTSTLAHIGSACAARSTFASSSAE